MTEPDQNFGGQPYELFVFARKHGIALDRARCIIAKYGADRRGADAAAKAIGESDLCVPPVRH